MSFVVLSVIVLASIVVSAQPLWAALQTFRTTYGPLTSAERERAAGTHEDLGGPAWDAIKKNLGSGDHYVVVGQPETNSEASRQNLVTRTYASYWLLPAVQVTDQRRAEVAIYVNPKPNPAGAQCFSGRWSVCFRRLP